ncbi:MAG: DUF5615 family PIN-like protein [Kiritimatiellia bacterium]
MRAIVDNNLPVTMVRRIREMNSSISLQHLSEIGLADAADDFLRKYFVGEEIVWISRDEDFWINSPNHWSVVWISLHNPKLQYLTDVIAPTLVKLLAGICPAERVLISEDGMIKL